MALVVKENKVCREKKVHKVLLVQEGGPASRVRVVSKETGAPMVHPVHKVSAELTVYQDSQANQATLAPLGPQDTQESQV